MKRYVSYLLVLVLIVLGLAACGKKENKSGRGVEMTTEVVEEELAATPEDATPDKASLDKATPEDATPEDATPDDADSKEKQKEEKEKLKKEKEMQQQEQQDKQDQQGQNTGGSSNGKVIVLDPGHSSVVKGGTEPIGPGAGEQKAADSSGTRGSSSGLTEYELNFQIATKLQAELEARGYTVILTRYDNNTGISCSERAAIANNAGADVFLRIHADGSDSSSASGAMAICITPSNPYIPSMYSESRVLSDSILNEYVAATGFSSRGVWETDTMTGNNWATVPTTLIEMGFMTNPNEDTLMADPSFQDTMVQGLANGIDKYCFTD